MRQSILIGLTVIGAWVACSPFAWAQAAAEYGIVASKSAAATVKASSTLKPGTKQVADRLQRQTTQSLRDVMQQNKQKLEEKSREGGGTLRIDSVPDKAAVSIDGTVVGYTPMELKLAAGKHSIELTRPGFLTWRQGISLSREETLSRKAELENKYKSSITLSNQK